jgi:hypothetical protein
MRILATFLLVNALAYATSALAQEEQFIRTAQNFCYLDAAGKRLNPVGAKEIAKILLREDPWQQQTDVIVISDYSVCTLTQRKDTAELVVDYLVLGRRVANVQCGVPGPFLRLERAGNHYRPV